ncbi:hypothetical protein ACFWG9_32550, partial [Streptomyces sp. NPDC060333]
LRLARIGVPLAQTAPEGLAAAGIDPVLLPPAAPGTTALPEVQAAQVLADTPALTAATAQPQPPATPMASPTPAQAAAPVQGPPPQPAQPGPAQPEPAEAGPVFHGPAPFAVEPTAMPAAHNSAWFAAPLAPQAAYEGGYNPQYVEGLEPIPVMPPTGPEEQRRPEQQELPIPAPRSREAAASQAEADTEAEAEADTDDAHVDEAKFAEAAYEVFRAYLDEFSQFPTPEQVDIHLSDRHGIVHPRSASMIRRLMPELKQRYQRDLENEHIA